VTSLDLSWAVRSVDAMLRRRQGIEEFTDDPACIFRISLARAGRALVLSDGAAIRPADPIVEIHYWNEHLSPIPEQGLNPAWAASFKRGLRYSLALVADLVAHDPRFGSVVAIHGAPAFAVESGAGSSARISERLGYDVVGDERAHGPIHAWLDSVLVWFLMWTFNRTSTRGRGISHGRIQIWMSRRKLIERYGRDGKVSP
jgi:hypothetical protein